MKTILFGWVLSSCAAMVLAQTPQQWAQCAERAGRNVDVAALGQVGYAMAIAQHCGERPVNNTGMANPEGRLPSDVMQSPVWKARFLKIASPAKYQEMVRSVTVSSAMVRDGQWLVGSGYDPAGAGASKAAVAVNTQTGEVMVALLLGSDMDFYGFDEHSDNAPQKLWQWVTEQSAGG